MKKIIKGVLFVLLFVISGICFSCGEKEKISLEKDVSEEEGVSEEAEKASDSNEPSEEAADIVLDSGADMCASSAEAGSEEGSGEIQIHVCGAVVSPGVYTLPTGSRLYQAVECAGGMTAEAAADYLNLAGTVADGEKVQVPTKEEVEKGQFPVGSGLENQSSDSDGTENDTAENDTSGSDITGGNSSALVNINTADAAMLMTLPGIGSAKADSIIAYRTEHKGFQSKEEIMKITGIKQAVYEKIKDLICVK